MLLNLAILRLSSFYIVWVTLLLTKRCFILCLTSILIFCNGNTVTRHYGVLFLKCCLLLVPGELNIVKYIYDNDNTVLFRFGGQWIDHCLLTAIESKRHVVAHWLFGKLNKKNIKRTLEFACYQQSMGLLKWLHKNSVNGWTPRLMDIACEQGYFNMVVWFHMNRKEGCTEKGMYYAIRNKNLDLVKYLHAKGLLLSLFFNEKQ